MKKHNKFYITTSIMYVNSAPHVGFALELVCADVLARYKRLAGEEVFFVTGADEHGKKIYESSVKSGVGVQEFVDINSQKIKDLAIGLDISNDFFIRTTDKELHAPAVNKIWDILEKKGDIYKKEYEGLYCVGCEAFLPQRELKDGKCPIHLKEPEVIKESNYFFKLSKYLDKVVELLGEGEFEVYPGNRKLEALNMAKEMIKSQDQDLSVSRPSSQVPWGIPVPGDESQNIYVWFDALINYLSALDYAGGDDKFKKYWPADVHMIGKDIVKFHTIIWPAVLMAAQLPMPKKVLVHGFVTSEGQKISKSLGNVVDPFAIVDKYGADAFRYFFLSEASMFSDIDYTEQRFMAKYNSDLSHGLGNLVNRILSIAKKNSSLLEDLTVDLDTDNNEGVYKKVWEDYNKSMENHELEKALDSIWQFVTHNNQMVEMLRLWELPKTDEAKFRENISNFIENMIFIAWLLQPFLPKTSDKIFDMLSIEKGSQTSWKNQKIKIGEIKPLFPKIETEQV